MEKRYQIAKIGEWIRVDDSVTVGTDIFVHNKKKCKSLLPANINVRRLLQDLKYVPNFIVSEDDDYLYLILILSDAINLDEQHSRHLRIISKIIHAFFDVNLPTIDNSAQGASNSDGSSVTNTTEITNEQLYEKLRDAHTQRDTFDCTVCVQHNSMKPTLTEYQTNAVQWMLHRENNIQQLPSEFIEIAIRWPVSDTDPTVFYYHPRKGIITDKWISSIDIPTGGILAEEMGLGKTVEMLSLILLSRKPINIPKDDESTSDTEPANKIMKTPSIEEADFKCICTRLKTKDLRKFIQCTKCHRIQHRCCVLVNMNVQNKKDYICPDCWPMEPIIQSAATIIVSPASIKLQWLSEVEKHIEGAGLKVLIYDGIKKNGWISPIDMAAYDIVLTDYNVMKSEIYFTNRNKTDRQMRNPSRSINLPSPLLMIDWWRVCLDEAQMVEASTNNTAQMVKLLPTIHRWAVTGTPLEKSVHDLYGLLFFMGCEPFDDSQEWSKLAQQFMIGNATPLIDLLQKVMWRTCKTPEILAQIKIPPQTEIVHRVTMSDLESFFYSQQHQKCLESFMRQARRVEESTTISTVNAKTLKIILEPLRKLRQDCTVPSIFERNNQATIKKSLKPDELFNHLVSNNEIECKSELRSIASSLNGLASLSIIQNDYQTAATQYKSVLRWAKDYTGNICVDSLLQIHALHNLLLMKTEMCLPDNLIKDYETELDRLEWKYIQSNADIVKDIKKKQMDFESEVTELQAKFDSEDTEYIWWSDLFNSSDEKQSEQLVRKILFDIKDQYKDIDLAELRSDRGLSIVIVNWLDRIREERQNVQKFFGKLKYLTDNIIPISQLDSDVRFNIERLVQNAFACHLDSDSDSDNSEPTASTPRKRKQVVECLLCKVKMVLETYECVIFDKKIVQHKTKDKEAVLGSWKPAYQEYILKILYASAKSRKNTDKTIVSDGKVHLKLLDALKNEFKEYSQLWVEINYTVSTYDEMNMCKSRLRSMDIAEFERNGSKKTRFDILTCEIDYTVDTFKEQFREAEMNFVRKLGTLKYLNHLEKNRQLENCPICDQQPQHRYAVLQCGHHMCMICCLRMKEYSHFNMKCSICRHSQRAKDLCYVNLRTETNRTDSSTKIEKIIETILELRDMDSSVKIIIFSHWSTILKTIENVLEENSITYRSQLNKFHLTIKEFKDTELNVTCLLLPLQYGSKGLNLIEATHVFLVEPILNPGEELQAIGRVHRIGQTKPTFVHRFIVLNTIEDTIYKTISTDETGKWKKNQMTIENLHDLFIIDAQN